MAIGENNNPNFNVQSPEGNQALVYDSSQQAFVNANLQSGSGVTGAANVGTGGGVFKQLSGSDLQFRTIVAGTNITITENTDDITISSTGGITGGINLGGGSGLFVDVSSSNVRLKSLVAGAGITLTNSNTEVMVTVDSANVDAGTVGGLSSSAFLQKSDNLAALSNVSLARTNLSVYSKAEADAKYQVISGDVLPEADNTRSIGSNSLRYSDIYAVNFHGVVTQAGTATSISNHGINQLSDVDTSGIQSDDVLKWNGSSFVPVDASTLISTGGFLQVSNNLSDLASAATARTNLGVLSATELNTNFFKNNQDNLPDADNTRSLGDNSTRFSDIYAVEIHGRATSAGTVESISGHDLGDLADVDTTGSANGHVLTYNGSTWISSADASPSSLAGLSDVSISGITNGQVIKWSSANSRFEPGDAAGTGATTFAGLTDTPANFSGAANRFVKVNSAGDALEFVAGSFLTDLSANDTDDLTEGSTNQYFTNARADARIGAASINALSDVDTSGVSSGQALVYDGSNWTPSAVGTGDITAVVAGTGLTGGATSGSATLAVNVGTGANQIVQLDGSSRLPAVDGSQLTNLPSGGIQLTALSVGADASASGAGGLAYNNTSGVFTYTPPDLSSYLTSVPAQSFASLTGKPTTIAGYGITDAVEDFADLSNKPTTIAGYGITDAFDGAFGSLTGKPTTLSGYGITDAFDGAFSSLTGKPTTLAGYGITDGYTNSDVDAHLNQSNPTSGYVLSWNGSDYAWVANAGGISDTDSLPEGSTNLYYTDARFDTRLQTRNIGNLADVDTTGASNGQALVWSSSNSQWEPGTVSGGGSYGDSDVDAHLNQSNPTAGYVLSWNGSDYAWVQDSDTVYTSFNTDFDTRLGTKDTDDLTEGSTNQYYTDARARGSVSVVTGSPSGSGTLSYNSSTGQFSFAPADLSSYLTDITGQSLYNLSNVYSSSSPSDGQVLAWNNSASRWEPSNTGAGDITAVVAGTGLTGGATSGSATLNVDVGTTANKILQLDGSAKIPAVDGSQLTNLSSTQIDASVSATEFGYLDGVTSSIQTQIDGKQATITGGASTITSSNLTATRALVSDGSGKVSVSTVTSTELGHLSGVTSAIQTQLDAKVGLTSLSVTTGSASGGGSLAYNNATGVFSFAPADLSSYQTTAGLNAAIDSHLNQSGPTSGYVLSWNGSDYAWVAQSGGSGTPGGSSGQVQYNDSGSFAGDSGFTYNASTDTVTAGTFSSTGSNASITSTGAMSITTASNGVINLDPHGSGVVTFRGNATKGAGQFKLNCENNSHGITIKGPPHSAAASYTLTLPNTDGSADQVLKTDGSGNLDWVDQSGGSALTVQDEGSSLSTAATTLNFVGTGVTASGTGATKTITINSGSGIALTDLSVTSASAFGNGSLTYNNSTGVFTFTPPLLTGYLEDITGENLADLADVNSAAPTDGQVLTWDNANSYWKPATVSGGGGSSGTEYEEFKLNYATNGNLSGTANLSSGISSVSIDSATGGDITITFTGYTTPPLSVVFYGYNYAANEYNMNTLGSTGTTLRKVPGGGSSGSPTAFGSFSTMSIKVREAETGASRSFGTTTHAWIRFVMGA